MRRILVVASKRFAFSAAASVALRTRVSGPVGLIILPLPSGTSPESGVEADANAAVSSEGLVKAGSEGKLPLPTPGAARVAAQLRRAGHRATARWRLVVCRPATVEAVDDAAAIVEAACGVVTAVSAEPPSADLSVRLRACDLAVGVVPHDAPDELLKEAGQTLLAHGREVAVLKLVDPGLGRSLPLSGICPPPDWAAQLDKLDGHLVVV